LADGRIVAVEFDRNEVAIDAGGAQLLQFAAYDENGRRLKQGVWTGSRGNSRLLYYWGEPVRLVVDVATGSVDRMIAFDIEKRPVDRAAYARFKESIEWQQELD
jgi:hypothetical protein